MYHRRSQSGVGNFLEQGQSCNPLVLVVEDSILVAMAIEDALIDRGMDVVVATTLASAAGLVAQRTPDAALLDLQLPDGNTLDLADQLRDLGCVVAFSSAFDADAVPPSHAFAAQFQKPASPDLLCDWIVASLTEV